MTKNYSIVFDKISYLRVNEQNFTLDSLSTNLSAAQRNNDSKGGKISSNSAKATPLAGFAPSKWETVDQKTVEAQAVTSKWDIFDQQLEV